MDQYSTWQIQLINNSQILITYTGGVSHMEGVRLQMGSRTSQYAVLNM